ncbi:MAG: hypothetical protein R3B47_10405 [Bacteroidia bacterium]
MIHYIVDLVEATRNSPDLPGWITTCIHQSDDSLKAIAAMRGTVS